MIELNKIYCENNLETMKRMPDNFVDLTVTSPPYDNLRMYKGYTFDFKSVAKELFRVTKDGGIVVWIVGDETINGSETGTSFNQAVFFMSLGFKCETMIYKKVSGATGSNKFYWQSFEYMFVLVKGEHKTYNLIKDRKNVLPPSVKLENSGHRNVDGTKKGKRIITRNEYGIRNNIWEYNSGALVDTEHPAAFPEELAKDHIYSWSNEGDLVYDPFMGSGTTAKMAHLLKRNWIGSEISQEYVDLANKKLDPYLRQERLAI